MKNFDEKEALELKMIYNHQLVKRSDIMKQTQFKVGCILLFLVILYVTILFQQNKMSNVINFLPKQCLF